MPRLENWGIVCGNGDPYSPPELSVPRLCGNIYNDHRFKDGDYVVTSPIVSGQAGALITRSGTNYELGAVAEDYEEIFPDAHNRVLLAIANLKVPK